MNFCKGQTTHERFSHGKDGDETSALTSSASTNKSSFIPLREDTTEQDNETDELVPQVQLIKKNNSSYVKFLNKDEQENIKSETSIKNKKPRWRLSNVCRMINYKCPTQSEAEQIAINSMNS